MLKETARKRIGEILEHWRGFPNTTLDGHYDFLTQVVVADSIESKHLLEWQNNPKNIGLARKILRVFVHETTHWLDHIGTLWGQKNLISIYNAYNAWLKQDEDEFWRIINLFTEVSQNCFADYYLFDGPAIEKGWEKRPWRYQFSCGLQFGINGKVRADRPFMTTRFNSFDGAFIKRVPMSTVSLLETIATAAEMRLEISLLFPLLREEMGEENILVESKIFEEYFVKRIYDPNLTAYSVSTHCLANFSNMHDISLAYLLSSALASLCLNLPSKVFSKLEIPSDFIELQDPSVQEVMYDRMVKMRENQDRSFAFFTLSQKAIKVDSPEDGSFEEHKWLNDLVTIAGLPTLEELKSMAVQEMEELNQEIIDGPLSSRLEKILEAGRFNFSKRNIYGNHKPCIMSFFSQSQDFLVPPILLGDDVVFDLQSGIDTSGRSLKGIEDWVFSIWEIESKLREFKRACFII